MSAFRLSVLFLLSNEDGRVGNTVFSSFSLLAAQATVEAALCWIWLARQQLFTWWGH